jgi:hypothetical protein
LCWALELGSLLLRNKSIPLEQFSRFEGNREPQLHPELALLTCLHNLYIDSFQLRFPRTGYHGHNEL